MVLQAFALQATGQKLCYQVTSPLAFCLGSRRGGGGFTIGIDDQEVSQVIRTPQQPIPVDLEQLVG